MKIKSFEMLLSEPNKKPKFSETQINQFNPPPVQPKRNSGRSYTASNRVLYKRHLHDVFENNEFLAYTKEAKTNEVILREFLLAFNRNQKLRYRFKQYKRTIGMYRKEFNEQKLFSSQPPPFLMSFQYDDIGFIVVGGNHRTTYMTFEDCYARCVEFQIADPRFVPHEYIVEIRNRQNEQTTSKLTKLNGIDWTNWIVPNEDTIKRLCTKIGIKDLYNSVRFPRGCTREETPIDED